LGVAFGRSQAGGLKAAVYSALDAPLERRPALLEAIGRAAPNPMATARELRQLRAQSSARPEQEICLDALAFGLGNKLFEYPGEVDARYFERRETAWCLNVEAFETWCAQLDATDRDREQLRAGYKNAFDERTGARYTR
jgi:hypothetical protein